MTTNRGWILSRYFLLGVAIATAAMLLLGCATTLDKNYAAYLAAQQAAVAGKKPQPIFELEAHDGQPITGLKSLRVFAPEGGGHQVALAPPPQREDFFDKSIRLLGAISPLAGTAIQTVYAHKSQVAQAQTNRDIALSTNATYAAFGNNIQGTATAGLAATRDTGVAGIAGVVSAANAGFAATTSIATGGFNAATGIAQSGFTAMAQSNGAAWANIGSLQPNITVGAGGVFGNGNRTTNGNGNDNSGVLVTGSQNRLNSNDDYSKNCASGAGASGGGGGGGTGGAAGNGAAGGAGATGGAAGGGGAGGSASGTTGAPTGGAGASGAPGGTGGSGGLGGTGGAGGFGSGGGGGAGGASGTVGC